jgi:hypothetical protein
VVFTDYHQPSVWHPLRPIMKLVFRFLEPYASSLLNQSLELISPACQHFRFSKKTSFGGLYQQVIATRLI